jgi:hypothetical protein
MGELCRLSDQGVRAPSGFDPSHITSRTSPATGSTRASAHSGGRRSRGDPINALAALRAAIVQAPVILRCTLGARGSARWR